MRLKLLPVLVCVTLLLVFMVGALPRTQAADMSFAATLVWGTNDPQPPPGKDYKPLVQSELRKKLHELPLKWTNWFEVRRVEFQIPVGPNGKILPPKEVAVSPKCELKVQNLNNSELEVVLIGKGKEVVRRKQALPKGELLMLGGNAENATAWIVILKRLD